MYNPLPHGLFIDESSIDGQGLYTNIKLADDTNLGMSHLELGKMMIRTPLGGFINHSGTPNCVKVKSLLTRQQWNERNDLPNDKYDHNFRIWDLVTIKEVEAGEELTVRYTFYTLPPLDFLEEAEKEKQELEESYKESVRQTKERKNK